MASAIENILFDLGTVMVHLNYEAAWRRVEPRCDAGRVGGAGNPFGKMWKDPVAEAYERGRASLGEVFERFRALTGYSGSLAEFRDLWCGIFSENEPMVAFGRDLADRYRLYYVTNTGPLHLAHLRSSFPFLRLFRDGAASCELGSMKPERAFFEGALEKFRVAAANCLLIDDLPVNVEGARAAGLWAVHYTDPARTIAEVRHLLEDGQRGTGDRPPCTGCARNP